MHYLMVNMQLYQKEICRHVSADFRGIAYMLQVTRNRYAREKKVDLEWYKDLIRNW